MLRGWRGGRSNGRIAGHRDATERVASLEVCIGGIRVTTYAASLRILSERGDGRLIGRLEGRAPDRRRIPARRVLRAVVYRIPPHARALQAGGRAGIPSHAFSLRRRGRVSPARRGQGRGG